MDEKNFAGLFTPGGYAPDRIRTHEKALDLVGISAGGVKGRTLTATPVIRWNLENAGTYWVDEAPTVDAHLISATSPQDLPEYVKAYRNVLKNPRVVVGCRWKAPGAKGHSRLETIKGRPFFTMREERTAFFLARALSKKKIRGR